MSTFDLVARAPSPKAALGVLARALDEFNDQLADVIVRLEKLEAGGDWEDWGEDVVEWDDDEAHAEAQRSFAALTKQDQDTAAAQQEVHMGMREGIMPDTRPPMGNVTVEETANGPVFVFPDPGAERRQERALLERQQLKLATALGEDAGDTDWTDAYVKGGPWWLYQHRRDLLMSYDFNVRQRMVADVEKDSPRLAYEMALDVLKQPAGEPDLENGSGALAVSNLTTAKVKHG